MNEAEQVALGKNVTARYLTTREGHWNCGPESDWLTELHTSNRKWHGEGKQEV